MEKALAKRPVAHYLCGALRFDRKGGLAKRQRGFFSRPQSVVSPWLGYPPLIKRAHLTTGGEHRQRRYGIPFEVFLAAMGTNLDECRSNAVDYS